jgi:4-hydroxybenzoyl-CoA reductase subunit beta
VPENNVTNRRSDKTNTLQINNRHEDMVAERKYLKPTTLDEAIHMAHEHQHNFCYIAGGTDVLVNKYQGNNESRCLIDITGLAERNKIVVVGAHLKICSLTHLDELSKHEVVARRFPSLIVAAQEAATPMLRKTATIGGNILCENRCSFYNQSEWWREAVGYCLKCEGDICIATGGKKACFSRFVSDTAPVLISAGARIELRDLDGSKIIDLETMYTGDGIKPRNIPPTSILKTIILPIDQELKIVFKKLRPRQAVDFTSLTTAVSMNEEGKLKIVVGGGDPKPIVFRGHITGDLNDYIKTALSKSRMVDNDYYSRKYRREMLSLYLEQSFQELKDA